MSAFDSGRKNTGATRGRRFGCPRWVTAAFVLLFWGFVGISGVRAGETVAAEAYLQESPTRVHRSPTETSGPALAAGIGYQFGGAGGELLYAWQIPESRWRLAPHAGIGYLPSELGGRMGWAGGLLSSWGHRHRLVLDASYGLITVLAMNHMGATIAERAGYGLTASAGYEFMTELGVFFRVQAGASVVTDADVEGSRWLPTGNLAVGWKPW